MPGLELLSRVVRFDRENFGRDAWPEAVWSYELLQKDRYLAYVDAAGQIVALGGVAGTSEAEILTIGVDERWRRRGLARRLLGELLALAVARGAEAVFLEVRAADRGAQALYEQQGFRTVGRRRHYYHDDDALIMRWDVGATTSR